jgi:beta-lactamase regulating signal transducer with metallopeptidase domain
MNRVLLPLSVLFGTSSLLLVDSAIKGGLILLLAALVALALRCDSAATRHLVWLVAIVAMLVVPVFSAMLPHWQVLPAWAVISHESPVVELPDVELPATTMPEQSDVEVPSAVRRVGSDLPFATGDQPIGELADAQPPLVASEVAASGLTTDMVPAQTVASWNWTNLLSLVWAIGFCVLILRLMAARLMLWSSERRGTVIALQQRASSDCTPEDSDHAIVAAYEAAYQQLGIRQRVRVLIHSERTIPVVWGILRHRLLLPAAARQWRGEQLRSVLLHELAHIKRRDAIAQLLAQLACALHWFNPLVWFAVWRLHVERERACDDVVLASGVRASAYAEHLLNVTTRLSSSPWTQACGLAMAQNSSLENRLAAILSQEHNRRRVTATAAVIALLFGASIAIPVAMMRAAEKEDDPPAAAPAKDAPAAELNPKQTEGQELFRIWKANARTDGRIPGAMIGRLGEWVKYFIELNDGDGEGGMLSKKFEQQLPRFAATRDWTQADAVALLDDVAAIHTIPLRNMLDAAAERVILTGEPLPAKLADAPWGKPASNGLRVAWHLEPRAKEYSLGTALKSRLLVHNSGKEPVFFIMPSWQQSSKHAAIDGGNAAIEVSSTYWTTMARMRTYRLAPGAYCETPAPGIGVGAKTNDEDRANVRVGSWILAKPGDDVRFSPGAVEVRMSPFVVGLRHMNELQKPKDAADLWKKIIDERIARETPLPTGAADREQLLRRLVRECYDAEPGPGEIDAYVRDRSPGALHPTSGRDLLRTRVMHGRKISPFTGALPPGEINFRVLDDDADVDTPGQQQESLKPANGTKLPAKIEAILQWGKPVSGLRAALTRLPSLGEPKNGHYMDFDLVVQNVSNAAIRLTANSAAPDHRTVAVREDGSTLFRIVSKEPSEVDVLLQPREVAVLRVFPDNEAEKGKPIAENPRFTFYGMMDIKTAPEGAWTGKLITPDVSGAVVSGKQPAKDNNAATDESKPKPGTTLEAGIEQRLKWGEPVNGLRAAIMIRRVGDMPNDLFVVVQNVSRREIRLNGTTAANKRTLYIKRHGKIQQGLNTQEPRFGEVLLQPREVTLVPMFPPELIRSDSSMGAIVAESALKDTLWTMYVEIDFTNVPPGVWKGRLVTAETSGAEATVFQGQDNSKPASGEKLNAGIEQKLKWGEPANGLRAALAIRDSSDDPDTKTPDLYLAVQNVSNAPIHLNDTVAAPNTRYLTIYRDELAQSRTRIDDPTMANAMLQPREVTYLLMVPRARVPSNGRLVSKGQLLARGMLKEPHMMLVGQIKIEQAPAGAWTGTLVSGKTGGASAKGNPMPDHKTAQALFKRWQATARINGKIPGGALRSLVKATSNFVEYNPTDKRSPKLAELLKRMDTSRDWTEAEAVSLLNDVTAVYDSLPSWAVEVNRFSIADVMRTGQPLPAELESAPWGEAQPNGLRAAWLLDPQAEQHRLNTPLKSRLLYHNTGKDSVVFRVLTWNQSGSHKARDATGADITVRSTSWTTIGQIIACRLGPGDFTEVVGAGIGVGPNRDQEDWRNTRVGAWIHTKAGDEVTFTPDIISASGDDGRRKEVADSVWWLSFITHRLERDAPLPDDIDERKRLLDRAVRDLFGTPPTPEEFEVFLGDKAVDAMTSLAKRLSQRAGTTSFTGKLRSSQTKFHVLPVDPDAKNKPRLAIGPGRYELGNQVRLVIVGRGNVTDAKLMFLAEDAPIKSYKIKLPNGYKTWAIAWKRGMTLLWAAEKGKLWSVDFTNTAEVKETQIDPTDRSKVPKRFRDALRPTFERSKRNPPPPAATEGGGNANGQLKTAKIRSANQSGDYRLSNGRTLSVCPPTEVRPWLSVFWPETKAWPQSRLRIYPQLSAENHRNWAVVWEANVDELWFVDDTDVTRVHISNPAEVLVTRQGHDKDAVLNFKIPDLVRSEFQRLGYDVDRARSPEDNTTNEVTDGQEMLTAESAKEWIVEGTVTGADGKPMADVPIRMRTALSPTVDVAMTKTDAEGNYQVKFRLDLRTVARYRGVFVSPRWKASLNAIPQTSGCSTHCFNPANGPKVSSSETIHRCGSWEGLRGRTKPAPFGVSANAS